MLCQDEAAAREIYSRVNDYGLPVQGHFWRDDPENLEWAGPAGDLSDPETGLWIIYGKAEDLAAKSVRQGLSLLALTVQGRRRGRLSTMVLCDTELAKDHLPWPLQEAVITGPDNPGLGAKITARANMPDRELPREYRFRCHALPKMGLWLEAGPAGQDWNGVIFGAAGAEVEAMGIGKKEEIPEKSVLKYPLRDMRLQIGEKEFTAWAGQNVLSSEDSAFIKLKGTPEALVFGAYGGEDDAPELFHLNLV